MGDDDEIRIGSQCVEVQFVKNVEVGVGYQLSVGDQVSPAPILSTEPESSELQPRDTFLALHATRRQGGSVIKPVIQFRNRMDVTCVTIRVCASSRH